MVPQPVTFSAEPDTNTTIYLQWDPATSPRTHPLLLRYEILLCDTINNVNLTFGPLLSMYLNYTITDLEPNTEYSVSVVATSPQGRSDFSSLFVNTFPNCKPLQTFAGYLSKEIGNRQKAWFVVVGT